MRNHSLAGLVLMLALAGSLGAMVIPLSPAELAAQADVIVTGNVVGTTSLWNDDHSQIYTDVGISVARFVKDNSWRELTVRVPGGEVGDIGMAVEDMPVFAKGQQVSLYLSRTAERTVFKLASGGQGSRVLGGPKLYSYSGYHRLTSDCHYRINADLLDWENAIQAGANTWTAAGSAFHFYCDGTTPKTGPTYDSVNVVWRTNMGGGGILAQNTYWYNRKTKLVFENDIVFNIYYPWTVDGSPAHYDVQNIGTHEQGHCLVLNDLYNSFQSEQTMFGYADTSETKKRSLESGDIAGIRFVY